MVNKRLYRAVSGLYWWGYDRSGSALRRVLQPAIRLVAREQATPSPQLPLRRRLWLWRHGFLSRDDALYDLDERRSRYLSEYQRELTRPLNGRWKDALDNKLYFHRLLEPFDAHRPAVYAHLKGGRFIPIDDPITTSTPTTDDVGTRVRERLDRDGRLVLKPTYGTTGSRILVCESDGERYQVNGEETPQSEFESLVSSLDEYLVCEFARQASYAADLYPDSTNTIRPLTMWDPKTDEPFITLAVHRIGTDRSAPVDNWSRGGLTADVDVASGELSHGVRAPRSGPIERHESHPDTGTPIAGTEVPGWSAIREGILDIAANYPQLPYVGWDIVVTDDGEFTVIEGNSCTDIDLLQVHRPLLDDPRARRFYEHHGIVPSDE